MSVKTYNEVQIDIAKVTVMTLSICQKTTKYRHHHHYVIIVIMYYFLCFVPEAIWQQKNLSILLSQLVPFPVKILAI